MGKQSLLQRNIKRACLALGRFPQSITAREGCPFKVKKESWRICNSSVKRYLNEMSSVTLVIEQVGAKESRNDLMHKSGKRSQCILCMDGKPQPSRASVLWNRQDQEAGVKSKLSAGVAASSTLSPQGHSLRLTGEGTGHRNQTKERSLVGRGHKEKRKS